MEEIETEVIILDAICSMIDKMINHEMMTVFPGSNIAFSTSAHAKLFNILLVDFLSAAGSKKNDPYDLKDTGLNHHPIQHERSYLHYLIKISDNPKFRSEAENLRTCATLLQNWLGEKICIPKVWLPTIDLGVDLRSSRYSLLKQSGTMAKHNPLKLNAILKSIDKTLVQSGHQITTESAYLVLDEYQNYISDHFFAASAGSIVVQLNNIRWAIHDYLSAEYALSFHTKNEGSFYETYSFRIPDSIEHPIAKGSYWNLMNSISRKPYINKFDILLEMHTVFTDDWNKRNP